MSARGPIFRIRAQFAALALALLFTPRASAQINLGLNPTLSSGSLTLNASDFFSGTYAISGSGVLYLAANYTQPIGTTLAFSGTGGTYLSYPGGGPFTFTLPSTAALTRSGGAGYTYVYDNFANSGSVTISGGGNLQFQSGTTLTNTAGATTTVTGAGSTLYLLGLANAGTLSADTNGLIQLAGAFTTANLGFFSLASGGAVKLTGTLNNASATLTAPSGGAYTLAGGTITGGTIASAALTTSSSGGTLDGATVNGNLTLASNDVLTLKNSAGATGTTTVNNAVLYLGTDLSALAGSSLMLTGANSYLSYTGGGPFTFTLPATTSLTRTGTGYTYVYDNLANSGSVTVSGGSNLQFQSGTTLANTAGATTTVTGAGSTLYLIGLANSGTLAADTNGLIQLAGAFTTANLGSFSLASGGALRLTGTLNNASANLTAPSGGTVDLYGGTITGGTVAAGAVAFTNSGGYLDGATLTGDLSLPANTYVRFVNAATFTGTNLNLAANSGIYWQQVATLAAKTITFTPSSYLYLSGINSALTLGATTTGSGQIQIYPDGSAGTAITNQGTLTNTSGSASITARTVTNSGSYVQTGGGGSIYADTFTNSGTISATNGTLYLGYPSAGYNSTNTANGSITANGSGANIYLRGNFTNAGALLAQNSGILTFDGANTTANLGSILLSTGGRVRLAGTLNNASATLTAPSGGTFDLYGGTLTGGTIASGTLTFTSSGGYLDGTTLTGDLSLPANTYVRFLNGTTFTGANLTLASNAGVYWQQIATLTNRTLTFGSGAYLYVAGVNNSLTLATTTTATGQIQIYHDGSAGTTIINQGTLTNTSGSASITARTVTNSGSYAQTVGSGSIYADTFTNSGAISATGGTLYLGYPSGGYNSTNTATGSIISDGSGTNIYLRGNFTNLGAVTAQNSGLLTFDGTNTTANLGAITLATGGRVRLAGTLNNASATLAAPSGGTFDLYGGTLTGGTIAAGTLTFTNSGGYLDGTTLAGDLSLPASAYVRFLNGTTFTGANLTLASNAGVYWQQVATLANRTLTFGSGAYLYLSGINNSVTLAATTTATGQIQIYHDGSAGTVIINQGTLTNTSGSGQIYARTVINSGAYSQTGGGGSIYADTFTNSGSISATSGTLYLGYPSAGYNSTNTATGSILSSGSGTNVYLRGNFANAGAITTQNSGLLTYDGANLTANLGAVTLATGGRARLSGTLNNASATLNAPSGGTFDLYGGTLTGGTIAAGALTFTGSGGYLDGTTLSGDLSLPASAYIRLTNGTTFTGTNLTLAANSGLYWQQAATLAAKILTFGSNSYLYLAGINAALTLDAATSASGSIQIYTDGSIGTAITNQGTLNHTSGYGQIYATTFTNSGAINASGGNLYLGTASTGYSFTNTATGTLTVSGGATVYLQAPVTNPIVNNGAINVQSGTLTTNYTLTTTGSGSVSGAGTINGNLAFTGGSLNPGNNGTGTLSLLGNLTLGSGSVTNMEIGASSNDRIAGINTLTLGGQLNVYVLSTAFSSGQTWNLFNATTITGNFANVSLPYTNGGWVWDTSQLATTGNLTLTTFVPVPEPSTYLLLAAGLGVIFALHRRKK